MNILDKSLKVSTKLSYSIPNHPVVVKGKGEAIVLKCLKLFIKSMNSNISMEYFEIQQ